MPYTAEEIAHWMNVRAKRLSAEKCQKRQLVFKRSAAISFCILAVYIAWSPAMTAIEEMSVWVAADVSPSAASSTSLTWAFKTAGTLCNTTYTSVRAWVHNITPTNATDAPVAPPPAPPKEAPPAPRDPKNAPKHSTNSSTTNGHNKTEDTAKDNTTRGENKTEDATNNTTRGENKTEDAANNSTTGSEEATDSPYTVLRVLGEVAVFAVSFAGYGCYLIATMG